MGYVTYDPNGEYAGKLSCGRCHRKHFENHARSGHGFKLNPVLGGKAPVYPFSDITGALEMIGDAGEDARIDKSSGDAAVAGNGRETDNRLGTPLSYDDVSFVIGGFYWKARFMDREGYIVTGSAVQYNLATQSMGGYANNEMNKPYDCGECHTTGWETLAQNGGVHQDGLPGIQGTFEAPGIDCEACHGPGKRHATVLPSRTTIVLDVSSELCGDCHTRDGQNRIAASGGLTQHHEQFDELVRVRVNLQGEVIDATGTPVPPGASRAERLALAAQGAHYLPHPEHGFARGVGCNGCHDPHATTVFDELTAENGLIRTCTDCHADKVKTEGTAMTAGFDGARLTCLDCHMPYMAKSAVSSASSAGGPPQGDVSSHIFKIDLTASDQFTEDGKFTLPHLTATFACLTCHGGDPSRGSTIDLRGYDFASYRYHY
jgi:predicted CXXCH cytochrome family protein